MLYEVITRNPEDTLFEIGNEYIPTLQDKLPEEPQRLTFGAYGDSVDFYTLKGTVVV